MPIQKNARPEGAVELVPEIEIGKTLAKQSVYHNSLPPLSSFVPRSLNYGGQAGPVVMWAYTWA